MAEINIPANNAGRPGVARCKKLSTRVDLTPMVDLGFLLLTFFIFSSKLSESKALKLYMPAEGTGTVTGESTALTIIPMAGNKLFYYHGSLENALLKGEYGATTYAVNNGLGQVIRKKQLVLGETKRSDLLLMIKPADSSTCGNMVDVLDEVTINQVNHYAIMDLRPEEKATITTKTGFPF
jgi:biopolymer transport protein ExbD